MMRENLFPLIFKLIVAVLYLIFGGVILYYKNRIGLDYPYNYAFATILILYGSYRLYRVRKEFF